MAHKIASRPNEFTNTELDFMWKLVDRVQEDSANPERIAELSSKIARIIRLQGGAQPHP